MQVFNAKTQQLETVTWAVDANGELVATFADSHFYKFPGDVTQEELAQLIEAHQRSNEGQEVITPEAEAAKAAAREQATTLANELNNGLQLPVVEAPVQEADVAESAQA